MVDTIRALTGVDTLEVVIKLVANTERNTLRVFPKGFLESIKVVALNVSVAGRVENSVLNIILIASSLIVGVGIFIKVDGTDVLPESVSISRPATLATEIVGIARNQVLFRETMEGTVVDGVVSLSISS